MRKLKNIKMLALGVICSSLVFTSCLKSNDPSEDYSKSPALVSFQYTGFSAQPFTVGLIGTPNDSFSVEVTLSVSSLTLKTPVTATIAADQASLDAYNSENGTDYVQLSDALYVLQDNGNVTINPGQQIVNFTIHFAGDQIDFNQANALALKITDANGAVVASNLNTAVLLIQLKSIYEGTYSETGDLTRYNGGSEATGVLDHFGIAGTAFYSTVNPTTIEGEIVIPGFVTTYTKLTVNPDNTVTIGPSAILPSNAMENTPNTVSTYDPATKTFDIHGRFLNSAGNMRHFDYTMTLQ